MCHDVTPVARGIAYRQQYRLAGLASNGKRLVAPRIPVNGVVSVLQQLGTGFFGEAIWHGLLYHTGL
jgi:hypothetical protein